MTWPRFLRALRSPTRWLIWANVFLRTLAYPVLIGIGVAVIVRVANADQKEFWAASSYGGVMLAAALSGVALALVRLGDGRFETEKGKSTRRNARHATTFWLAAFVVLCVMISITTLMQRIPSEIETPWLRAPSESGPADPTKAADPGAAASSKAPPAGNEKS